MSITGYTRLVGIFGHPVKHTRSPAMHNAAFSCLGLDYVYLPFEVAPERLEQALRALPALRMAGVNLTIPHKERALPFLDEITPQAELIGAVNTVKVEDGRLIGYNTDGAGFVQSLKTDAGIEPKDQKVCLLGAGGAARAVAVALAMAGIRELVILNRSLARAQALAGHLAGHFPGLKVSAASFSGQEVIKECRLIINSTSVGMKESDGLLINPELIQLDTFFSDLIYTPARTKLMTAALERGAKVMNGLGMLVYQGALAFEIWTGRKAPMDIMRKELINTL